MPGTCARGKRIGNKPLGGLAPKAVWCADAPTKLAVAGGKLFRFEVSTEEVVAVAPCSKCSRHH